MDNFSFEQLQIFFLFCELKSFSHVARKMGIDQSTVSRNIKSLEKELDKKLIATVNKPVTLTKEGEKLYNLLIKFDSEINHIKDHLISQSSDFAYSQFRLFLAMPEELGFLISKQTKYFLKDYPELLLDLSFEKEMTFDLLSKTDIVLNYEVYDNAFVDNKLLGSFEIVCAANINYLKKRGIPRRLENLKDHNIIKTSNRPLEKFARNNDQISLLKNLTVKYIVDNEISLYKLIESGVGIGFIPRFIVKELKNVVEIALEPLCVFDIYSVRSNVRNSSHLEIVETFLKNSITSGVCYDQNKQSNNKNRRFRKHPRA